jgi:hypothetical protein
MVTRETTKGFRDFHVVSWISWFKGAWVTRIHRNARLFQRFDTSQLFTVEVG